MGAEEFLNIEEEHKREFSELLQYCLASGRIDQNLYQEYDVKRGLRDSSGKGVLTGLTIRLLGPSYPRSLPSSRRWRHCCLPCPWNRYISSGHSLY